MKTGWINDTRTLHSAAYTPPKSWEAALMRASYPLTLLTSIRAEHKTNLCLSKFSLCEFKDILTQWGKNIQGWSAVCLSKYSKQKASMCKQGGVPIISATERWNGRGGHEFKVMFVCSFCDHPGLHETMKQTKRNTNRCYVLVIYWASTACPTPCHVCHLKSW